MRKPEIDPTLGNWERIPKRRFDLEARAKKIRKELKKQKATIAMETHKEDSIEIIWRKDDNIN